MNSRLLRLIPVLFVFTFNAGAAVQKIRETTTEVLYSVQSPNELTPEQVTSLMIPGKSTRIEWPRQEVDSTIFLKLSKQYYIQFGMEAHSLRFNDHLASFQVRSFDEDMTKRLVAASYESGYAEIWKDQLTKGTIKKIRDNLISLVNDRNTRFIELDGKIAGMIMVDAFETYRGKHEDHLGWIWIDSFLSKAIRQSVAASLLQTAAKMAPGKILAGVYIHNIKSISFLRDAGFEAICAQLLQP